MKQKLSILLAVVLLLSLFAGCTPADVPSTDDSSADASVTDSNTSDTSLSETDGVISETNTDAATDTSTDTSTDSSTTDIYTNIGTSTNTESSEPVVEKTVLDYEDFRNLLNGIVFGESELDDVEKILGKERNLHSSFASPCGDWQFENFYIICPTIRNDYGGITGIFSSVCLYPQDGNVLVEKDVNQLLLAIGIDTTSEKPVVEESVDEKNKSVYTKHTYTLRTLHGNLSVMVGYYCYSQTVPGHTPALIGTPYCNALIVKPVK